MENDVIEMEAAPFDFKNPDYVQIFKTRIEVLTNIRKDPALLPHLRAYYKDHPAQFIVDWGCTLDAKLVEKGLPAYIPFILFPRQMEWVDWVIEHWHTQKPGLTEKTRQMGMSWLSVATACTLCLFNDGMSIGFGSRKETYVDNGDDPKSLFYKARFFLNNLPPEFRGGWQAHKHAPHMRILIPATGATITGEAGDNIGRGATTGIYFVDEAAFIERPQLVEASLSQTTNCRMDISTPNGMANPFAEKRFGGRVDVFPFHWRDDPRKDEAWYDKQKEELDPVTLAQEVDIDYAASVEGIVIPPAWVRSAVDAHLKLNITPAGARTGSLDVADEGVDMNAFCGRHGIMIQYLDEWSGKAGDIFESTEKAFTICDTFNLEKFKYDADGLGAGVRGDARVINENRARQGKRKIECEAYRGSEGVFNPEGEDVKGRTNQDYFANRKAQAWWALRARFEKTHRWVVEGVPCNKDEIISIPSGIKHYQKLVTELSQATSAVNGVGKIVIDKKPDGSRSPNLADSVVIEFSTVTKAPMRINLSALRNV